MDGLSLQEERVVDSVRETRDELVSLATELVGLDTTARGPGDPPRDEERLQRILEKRLRSLGAETELWEPATTDESDAGVMAGIDFVGRPQLIARVSGSGGGRSLLLNGHIDAVDVAPRDQWLSDPFRLEIRDGRAYGRGVADMKGGIVSHVVALETLQRLGVQLRGDVVFCTVTDEESTGAGSWAAAHHGVHADACICGEPSGFDAWVACRGGMALFIDVEGRAGHRDVPQPHWRKGGAVNAIEKMRIVLDGITAIREDWLTREDHQHPLLAPGDVVPTIVSGGTWRVTYPASVRLTCGMLYPPGAADEHGLGTKAHREVSERLQAYAQAADPWFIDHPVVCTWLGNDVGPAEIPGDHPLVSLTLDLGKELGRDGKIGALDSWHDAANFTRIAGIPAFSYGPDGIGTAHAVNECVEVDGLVDHCCITALTLMRWCAVG